MNQVKASMDRMTVQNNVVERGHFPAQPQPNPRGQIQGQGQGAPAAPLPPQAPVVHPPQLPNANNVEQVKAITTLRSGKLVDNKVAEIAPETETIHLIKDKETILDNNEKEKEEDINQCPILAPYPQRLKKPQVDNKGQEILELFKQVKINIPLLDAIKQVPSYAKLLKDLCTIKRRSTVRQDAFVTEQASSIIQQTMPLKYKDPGCPTISCVIGNFTIEHALLDLGSSVNLLPYSVYHKLGLGELKETRIVLQLADRSVKVPRGIIEDVLIQVDKFVYPVDFVVLDTQPVANANAQILIILGRPFLATIDSVIRVRNGIMTLSYGNMSMDVNIFNIPKQPNFHEEEIKEVDCVDALVQDYFDATCLEDPVESCIANFVYDMIGYTEPEREISYACASLDSIDEIVEEAMWTTHFEELPLNLTVPLPSDLKTPKLELKKLPDDLKHAYLGPDETFPVIVSSALDNDQESKLLSILKKHKGALGWTLADLKGISPAVCTHRIYLEDNAKPTREMQRRLNPNMKEVVRGEVLKLLEVGVIYPISDSK